MSYGCVEMLMEKLKQLISCTDIPLINNPAVKRKRPRFRLLYDELHNPLFQTLFIHRHQHQEKLADLRKRFIDAAQEALYIVDLFLSGVHIRKNGQCYTIEDFNHSLNLADVRGSIDSVKVELMSMNVDNMTLDSSQTTINQSAQIPIARGSKKLLDEIVVGLDGDVELIRDKLVEDQKKVDVVSIVGMGGIGKTTLATKVFGDPFIMYHFHVRVWVTVSQSYDKRDVLIQILESIGVKQDLEKDNSESRLRELVHKNLMGKRYLIVIDDIWHKETWDHLKLFFPHDNNGSRILLTTRLTEVAKHANSHGLIHHVSHLSKERSWELLCKKVFHGNECPEWSIKHGMEIVENCKGLPLAVAVIGGVLAKEALSEKFWVDIAERMGLYSIGDLNGCLETLGLSYIHLPLHLRECFLYLGGFAEDYKIKVKFLIRLWVAEGFIEQDGNRSLDDIAEGYLMDLIDRNLVIVADKRDSNGGVKACKLHDLVRELCLRKGNEEGFFSQDITTPPYKPARKFMNRAAYIGEYPKPSLKNIRALLWFGRLSIHVTRCFHSFVLLRVLDIHNFRLAIIPKGLELLVHLRYLAIWSLSKEFPSSICNLWNLQTLIYNTGYIGRITLPSNISNLVNLSHLLHYKPGFPFILLSIERPMKLQTILGVRLGDGVHNLQTCFPYLKELGCFITNSEYGFKSLTYLEKLKLTGFVKNHITFPATLKTLTLKGCGLVWSDMSIIQSLPNLQVLKLKEHAFKGSCWNTNGQEFPQLKFLRLWELDIKRWEAYSTTFPCLRQLQVMWCVDLEEIPLEIGEIPTLELIKIKYCRPSVGESVRRIQKEQHELGNFDLKIEVNDDISDNDISDEE